MDIRLIDWFNIIIINASHKKHLSPIFHVPADELRMRYQLWMQPQHAQSHGAQVEGQIQPVNAFRR